MKNLKLILIIHLLLGGFNLSAQQKNVDSYRIKRADLIPDYLTGKISEEVAKEKIIFYHDFFRKNNQSELAFEKEIYLSLLYLYSEKADEAIEQAKIGLQKVVERNDSLTFKYQSLLAKIYAFQNETDSSQHYYQKCHKSVLQNKILIDLNPLEVSIFLSNYAIFLANSNEIELRESILRQALALSKKTSEPDLIGYIENNLATLYIDKKELEKAIIYQKQAIIHDVKPFVRLPRLLDLADLYATQKRWNDFNKTLTAAKRDYAQIKEVSGEFIQHGVQLKLLESEYLATQNNRSQAISKATEAVALALSYSPQSRFLAEAYIQAGDLSTEIPAKITAYNTAITAVSKSGEILYPREYLEALRKRAALEPTAKALETYQKAIAFSAQTRKAFTSEESKYFYEEALRPLFGNALAVAAISPNETFNIMEQSKAAVLSEVLQDRRIKYGNVNADLLKEEKQLQQAITKLKTDVSTKAASGSVEKLRELQIKQEFLSKKIEKESPNYFKLKYQNTAYSAKEIQEKLDENTALLSYYKSDSVLYISVLTKSGIVGKKVKLSADYQQCMDYFRKVLYANPGLGNYTGSKAAQCMYGYLIKPVEKELAGKKRLLVIRDAELNLLPFEVLEYQPQKYLLSRFTISYNYAASLLFSEAENKKRNLETLSFAPYAERSVLQNKSRDRSLGALPFSNKEVSEIGGNIYRDKAATKKQFMEDYRKNGIIHFATHAQIDDVNPSKSFIAFYPDSVDYKLYTSELYNLSLENTQLVVLSACEAGRGKIQGGEGMLSLARGFAYAGCPAVITTLWNAHDESSAYLAERLHHYLKKGLMKDEALQQAKLDFINADIGRELNHPYYWANFILIGDASAIYEPTNWWLWGSIGLLVLLTIWFAVRFWKRSS